ncbi:MAG: hypothetical protein Q9170_007140, partial [Blastenia crenularia]
MARIEELSDQNTDPVTAQTNPDTPFPIPRKSTIQDGSTTPSIPPIMDSVRSHSADEIVQMMKKTPLFMTNLDEGGGGEDDEENIQLEALRALQYEGTRAEIALGFKERGNEMVAEKRWKDAKEFYTKGILALKAPENTDTQSVNSIEESDKQQERQIEEACFINRALCNLELRTFLPPSISQPHPPTNPTQKENYRSTLHDTAQTLHLSPQNPKAHYRSSLALLHLSRHTEALDTCTRGLALTNPFLESTNTSKRPSAEHSAFLTLRTRILSSQSAAEAKETTRINEQERKKKEQLTLAAAIRARGIK